MEEKLRQLIDESEYVSFDIFDTAVLRAVQKPIDLFGLVEKSFGATKGALPFDYRSMRVESERRARDKAWRLKKSTEISIDEIYHAMREISGIDHATAEDLKCLEIDTETKACTRNEFIYSVYRYCLTKGKKVIFTSDMYLPLETTATILTNAGYQEFHKIFLSSSVGITKSTGELYKFLLQELACLPSQVLHIGDNYDSDVVMAERHGLRTYYYQKCIDRAFRSKDLMDNVLTEFMREGAIEESIYVAAVVNRYCSNGKPGEGNSRYEFWYDLGYKYVGMLFFGFTSWLLEQVQKDKVEKVFFLSRDGYIMKKVYDVMSSHLEKAPPSEYMYASRRALNIPAITMLDDKTLNFLVSGTSTLMVSQFLERVGLNPTEFARAIREAGFHDKNQKIITGIDYGKLRKLFVLISDDIKKRASQERVHLLEYFAEIGLLDHKKIGVVDIGWHGTLQRSISRMLKLSGKEGDIKGYYLGTFSEARDVCEDGYNMSAYLCELARPEKYHDLVKLCVEIFEFIHVAPHGSVVRFEKKNGNIEPVLEEKDIEPEKVEKAGALQRGALDFVEELVNLRKRFGFLNIPKELALKPLSRVLRSPTYEEAVNLGDLGHAEGFGDVYVRRYIARPPALIKSLMNPYSLFQEYRQAFWKKGYKKRVFSMRYFFRNDK